MTRDELRAKFLGSNRPPAKELVELDGVTYEVRQPTVAQRGSIMKAAGIGLDAKSADLLGLQLQAVLELTFVPDTQTKVFDAGDRDVLLSMNPSVFDKLGDVATRMLNVADAAAKNSAPTPSVSSPSA